MHRPERHVSPLLELETQKRDYTLHARKIKAAKAVVDTSPAGPVPHFALSSKNRREQNRKALEYSTRVSALITAESALTPKYSPKRKSSKSVNFDFSPISTSRRTPSKDILNSGTQEKMPSSSFNKVLDKKTRSKYQSKFEEEIFGTDTDTSESEKVPELNDHTYNDEDDSENSSIDAKIMEQIVEKQIRLVKAELDEEKYQSKKDFSQDSEDNRLNSKTGIKMDCNQKTTIEDDLDSSSSLSILSHETDLSDSQSLEIPKLSIKRKNDDYILYNSSNDKSKKCEKQDKLSLNLQTNLVYDSPPQLLFSPSFNYRTDLTPTRKTSPRVQQENERTIVQRNTSVSWSSLPGLSIPKTNFEDEEIGIDTTDDSLLPVLTKEDRIRGFGGGWDAPTMTPIQSPSMVPTAPPNAFNATPTKEDIPFSPLAISQPIQEDKQKRKTIVKFDIPENMGIPITAVITSPRPDTSKDINDKEEQKDSEESEYVQSSEETSPKKFKRFKKHRKVRKEKKVEEEEANEEVSIDITEYKEEFKNLFVGQRLKEMINGIADKIIETSASPERPINVYKMAVSPGSPAKAHMYSTYISYSSSLPSSFISEDSSLEEQIKEQKRAKKEQKRIEKEMKEAEIKRQKEIEEEQNKIAEEEIRQKELYEKEEKRQKEVVEEALKIIHEVKLEEEKEIKRALRKSPPTTHSVSTPQSSKNSTNNSIIETPKAVIISSSEDGYSKHYSISSDEDNEQKRTVDISLQISNPSILEFSENEEKENKDKEQKRIIEAAKFSETELLKKIEREVREQFEKEMKEKELKEKAERERVEKEMKEKLEFERKEREKIENDFEILKEAKERERKEREEKERQEREEKERKEREEKERKEREEKERKEREEKERKEREEKERKEREEKERKEREEKERQEREEKERKEREEKERKEREEKERKEREEKERKEKEERERKEREEKERKEREEKERKEREEKERKEREEKERKEREEKERKEREEKERKEREEKERKEREEEDERERLKTDELARKKAEEAQWRAETEARIRAEVAEKLRKEEELRVAAEAEARRQIEEDERHAMEIQKRRAQEEARMRAEIEAKMRAGEPIIRTSILEEDNQNSTEISLNLDAPIPDDTSINQNSTEIPDFMLPISPPTGSNDDGSTTMLFNEATISGNSIEINQTPTQTFVENKDNEVLPSSSFDWNLSTTVSGIGKPVLSPLQIDPKPSLEMSSAEATDRPTPLQKKRVKKVKRVRVVKKAAKREADIAQSDVPSFMNSATETESLIEDPRSSTKSMPKMVRLDPNFVQINPVLRRAAPNKMLGVEGSQREHLTGQIKQPEPAEVRWI